MNKNSFLVVSALSLVGLPAGLELGCAAGTPQAEDDSEPAAGGSKSVTTSTTSGSGGSSAGGMGGAGGTSSSGTMFPCGIDCSTIQTEDCQKAECNMTTKSCEVVNADNGTECEDGLFCTIKDSCVDGLCMGGVQNTCDLSPAACEEALCDEAAKGCTLQPASDGSPCNNPDDLCIVNETCQSGVCKGVVNDCFFAPVPNECFDPVCNPKTGICEPVPGNDGAACVDSADLCTKNKSCLGGQCQGGAPLDCNYLTKNCDSGVCDSMTGTCTTQTVPNGQMCDDLSACTTGEICSNGMCGNGTPVTNCEMVGDGCCPTGCDKNTDKDCAVQESCLAIKTSVPSSSSGIYTIDPDGPGPQQQLQVFCDMNDDQGGWTLLSRFATTDAANWMLDSGEWWFNKITESGATTNVTTNADMLSRAFWTVKGTEIRLSRSDNPTQAGLLVTNTGCIPTQDFRSFITGFGDFSNGKVWPNAAGNAVAATCPAVLAGNYNGTGGFQYATCSGDIGAPNSISFWSDWSSGDGAVMMIGGGGNSCGRADHGIGVTEANAASFVYTISGGEDDFGNNGSDQNTNYALNLWIR